MYLNEDTDRIRKALEIGWIKVGEGNQKEAQARALLIIAEILLDVSLYGFGQ